MFCLAIYNVRTCMKNNRPTERYIVTNMRVFLIQVHDYEKHFHLTTAFTQKPY